MRALVLVFGLILLLGCVGTETSAEEKQPTVVEVPVGEGAQEAVEQAVEEPEEETEPAEEPEPEVQEESPLDDISHKELKFDTKDGWEIYGTVYYSESDFPTTLIFLVHGLGKDRSSYDELILPLHEQIGYADIIALDMRGHGKSISRGEYTGFKTGDFRAMKNDLEAVVTYFSAGRPSINNYYIIGASIGSSVALDYADEHSEVSKLVMLSPGTEYREFEIIEDAEYYLNELYLVAGSDDHYSAASVEEIYSACPSDNKVKKIYYGMSAHGTDLIEATAQSEEPLSESVVEWLE